MDSTYGSSPGNGVVNTAALTGTAYTATPTSVSNQRVGEPVGETGGRVAVRVVMRLDERSSPRLIDRGDLVAGRDEPWTVGVHPTIAAAPPTLLEQPAGHHATAERVEVIVTSAATSCPAARSTVDVAVIDAPVAIVLSTKTSRDAYRR